MSRFLFTCWPFVGHVFPQMAIATALRRHGHEVAFYTGPEAHRLIDPEGIPIFEFQAVEPKHYAHVEESERHTQGKRQSMRLRNEVFRQWLVESIPSQIEDLRPIIDEWQPDAILTDLSMWGPITILWESVPIPVVLSSTFMGPLVPGPDAPAWGFGLPPPRTALARAGMKVLSKGIELAGLRLRRPVDAFRAEHGLGPLGMSMNAFTGRLPLYIVGNVPELDYGRRDLPPSVHYLGACLWHPPEEPGTAAWLEGVPTDRPWVHVTESTLQHGDPFILRAAAQGLAGSPVEAILTTGSQREPDQLGLGAIASNVHITRWLSHRELLPRCAVVVTAGGPATITASLAAGVPLVVVPTTWDKPDNARRVVEAGVGVRLAPKKCTPERLRDAVDEVLNDPAYARRAQEAAEKLAAAPGPDGAVKLLEDLVAR